MKKRILSLVLALLMVVSIFPADVFAEEGGEAAAQPCQVCGGTECTGGHVWCDTCQKHDCGKTHVWCDTCKKNDCGKTHVWCDTCQKFDCGTTHVWCETCKKNDCGVDHTPAPQPEPAPQPQPETKAAPTPDPAPADVTPDPHTHSYTDGECSCGEVCTHAAYADGKCTTCGMDEPHTHSYTEGKCACGEVCTHAEYAEGKCKVCGMDEPHTHSYTEGKCACGEVCTHAEYADGKCTTCGMEKPTPTDPMVGQLVQLISGDSFRVQPDPSTWGTIVGPKAFPEKMKIDDVYRSGSEVLYKLVAADGYTWPTYTDGNCYEGYYLTSAKVVLVQEPTPCPTCGKTDCTSKHEKWCAECQMDNCTTHTWCDECGKYECGKTHNSCDCGCETCTGAEGCECHCGACDFCEKEPEEELVEGPIYGSVNGQTITVNGLLPEGARLTVTEAVTRLDGGFVYDIKILDSNGNEWQPANGQTVTLTIPVPGVENGRHIELVHMLENEEAIQTAIASGRVLAGAEYVAMFPSAAEAYTKATGAEGAAAYELFVVQPINGAVSINTNSFSIYFWNGSSRKYDPTVAGVSDDVFFHDTMNSKWSKETFYVTPGQSIRCNRGGIVATSREWKFDGITLTPSEPLTGAHGPENFFTVPNNATIGTEFTISCRILNVVVWSEWHSVKFVVVEERAINFYNGNSLHATDTVVTDGGSQKDAIEWPSTNPTKTNCNFVGWSTTSGSTSTISTSTWYPTAKSTNLYAVYNYKVQYNLNGGTGTGTEQVEFDNKDITIHGKPSRSGYNFLGWYSSVDNRVYSASETYTQRKNTTMTALWGKTSGNGSWNHSFYVLPGTTAFNDYLKQIDGTTRANDYAGAARPSIKGDSNIYYVAPGTTMTFACADGRWCIDGAKAGITTSMGTAWTTSNTATVTISGSAAVGTNMMIYSRTSTGTVVNCARIIITSKAEVTTKAINDTQNIYRVGLYILHDSTNIPGEPNYTTNITMVDVNGGMNYSPSASSLVSTSIANSANYIPSLDGSCTMGVVDYTGRGTIPYLDADMLNAAMDRVILALASGTKMIAADNVNLTELYQQKGEDYIRANYAVRPHIVKLMTGLLYRELGWHIDCSIYPQKTVTLTYNLNPPVGYVLTSQGTPAPGVYTGDVEAAPAEFIISTDIKIDDVVTASVSGSSDTASLTFAGWNTKPDGTGKSYTPGSTITLTEDDTLYAQWTGKTFNTGTLEIYKTVTVATGSQNPTSSDFTFEINLTGSYAYTVYNTTTGAQINTGTMTDGTFTLQDNQFIRFTLVPVATYTVTETVPTDYNNNDYSQTVALKGGYVNQLFFTNEYDKPVTNKVTYQYTNTSLPNGADKLLPEEKSYAFGDEVTVEAKPSLPGYSFQGWTPDVTLTIDSATSKFSMPSSAVVFKGTWSANPYTITYNHNDAVGNNAATTSTQQYTIESTDVKLKTLTRSGYKFTGWKLETGLTAPNGNWNAGTYAAETAVTEKYGNVTLVAQWEVAEADLTIYAYSDDLDHNFLINVSGNGINLTVAVPAGDSVTIKNLPVGTYTVKEVNDSWSWRIDDLISKPNVEVKGPNDQGKPANNTVTFDFGANDNRLWLNGYSYGKKGG